MLALPQLKKTKEFYVKYERYITPVAFLAGFIWDNLTLRRIDLWFENITFIWNIFLVATSIVLINAYEAGHLKWRVFEKIARFVPILMQFSFGGLFSAFFVFYSRSGSVLSSWPFLLFLLLLFLGNDFFRKRYLKLTFQLSVFFIVLFSYSVFAVPILVGKIGDGIFFASGMASLLIFGVILYILFRIIPEKMRQNRNALTLGIGSIFAIFQIFYFTNIIPPIPLSLKESGIYHSLERVNSAKYIYEVSFEPAPWYLFFKAQSSVFHLTPGQPVYSYSAVFAPTKLDTKIYHRWSYFDEKLNDLVESSRVGFLIIGGRDGGYRGYTVKYNAKPGKWRVEVITERGQVLGHRTFKIVSSDTYSKIRFELR